MNQWDDLRLFLAVAKSGTLTAAAAELGSNAATLHRRLKSFEESFELSLFEKAPGDIGSLVQVNNCFHTLKK